MKWPATCQPNHHESNVPPLKRDEILDRVALLWLSLESPSAIRAACVADPLNIRPADVEATITDARRRLLYHVDTLRTDQHARAVARLNDLYARALRVQDVKTALATQKELHRLLGLAAARATGNRETGPAAPPETKPFDGLHIAAG